MEYISVKEASRLWGIDTSNIGKLCRKGKIDGAKIVGRNWLIPAGTPKPLDGRTRKAKDKQSEAFFRFPLYINFHEDSFFPPLSEEETGLRQAQANFYACEFQSAKAAFEELSENANNIYVRICANFYMCVLSAVYDCSISWDRYYYSLNLLLSEDFPHNKEMELFLPWLDCITGRFGSIPEKLNTDSAYVYHSSAWCMNAFLSIFNNDRKAVRAVNPKCTEPFATLCHIMERDGYYIEAQELHKILFIYHYSTNNEKPMLYHLHKIIQLAYDHGLIYTVADINTYYSNAVDSMLREYPESFAERIHENSNRIYDTFSRFSEKNYNTDIYTRLSKNDYRYIFYATEGFTNRQVAEICAISERTAAKKYNDIYNKVGVFSKRELVNKMNAAYNINE